MVEVPISQVGKLVRSTIETCKAIQELHLEKAFQTVFFSAKTLGNVVHLKTMAFEYDGDQLEVKKPITGVSEALSGLIKKPAFPAAIDDLTAPTN